MKTLRIRKPSRVEAGVYPWQHLKVIEVPDQFVDFAGVRFYWDDSEGVRIYRYTSPHYTLAFRLYYMTGEASSADVDFYSIGEGCHAMISGEDSDLRRRLEQYFSSAGVEIEEL